MLNLELARKAVEEYSDSDLAEIIKASLMQILEGKIAYIDSNMSQNPIVTSWGNEEFEEAYAIVSEYNYKSYCIENMRSGKLIDTILNAIINTGEEA